MSDKKQPETEQPRQQNKGWSWGKWIIMMVLGGFSLFICWLYLSPEFICWLRLFPKQWATNNHIWLQLYLGALAVTGGLVLCKPQIITSSSEKYFITRVLTTGITGGAFALLLPIAVKSTTTGVGGLRHSILLATGGLLAILTLGETRRKNDIDKRKNEQEKEKNDKDHRRQVRAERRERYTKAVEQLGDEKAPVRMGGLYTLVGLVDEWLEDESIKKYEDRLKEGQVIVNNLCAYIRSPFTLASHYDELSQDTPTTEVIYKDSQQKSHKKWQIISNNLYACIRSRFTPDSHHAELSQDSYTAFYKDREQEFYADKANLKSEADVRLSIIKEIHDRLQGPDKNTPGAWSNFEYDFSGSTFFYPVDLTNSYYTKPVNFSGSRYYKEVDFSGSTYEKDVIFSTSDRHSTYQEVADFHESTYQGRADFSDSTYEGEATFRGSTYQDWVIFAGSTYQNVADFAGSTYTKSVIFSTSDRHSTYQDWVDFAGSTYHGRVDFAGSTYQYVTFSTSTISTRQSFYHDVVNFSDSTYKDNAIFIGSTYAKDVTFSTSDYQKVVNFSSSIYYGRADFSGSTHQNETYFDESIFYRETYFGKDGEINSFSRFTDCAPQFYDETNRKNTLFGSHNNYFAVITDECYPIDINSKGLPLGCKFLTSGQKEYLADKFQEIEETNNKLLEVKDPKEKAELSKKLQTLNEELHGWRKEATTVKMEDVAAEDTES